MAVAATDPAFETDLQQRVARLSLEQKVRLLTGADSWSIGAEPQAGLRRLVMSDGPVGVRGEFWDDRFPSANTPSPTALAASWDTSLIERVGTLLAAEAKRKGVQLVLAPTINLHRTPLGGRHFECFSEDPVLTGRIAEAYVRGLQDHGVGVCVKHFVANDQEAERMSVNVVVDQRTLRELYVAPFEHLNDTVGPWSYMSAYNRINGITATESPLMNEVIKGEWGSDALIVSDWTATRTTVETANAGLDIAMPGPHSPWGQQLVEAVRAGLVDEAVVDDKVVRLLRLAARTGVLEGYEAAPAPEFSAAEVDELLREAAAAGFVLVKNAGLLPLRADRLRRVAVIGPNAWRGRNMGGGSATVYPDRVVHPVEGLRAALPGVEVRYAQGVTTTERVALVDADTVRLPGRDAGGILVEFLDAAGNVLGSEERRFGHLIYQDRLQNGVELSAVVKLVVSYRVPAGEAGTYRVGGAGVGHFKMWVDGAVVLDEDRTLGPKADVVEALMAPPQAIAEVELPAGGEALVRFEYTSGLPAEVFVALQVCAGPPVPGDDAGIEAAVELAASSDAVVVVVGTTEEVESEGYDRRDLRLPGRQDELVAEILAVNPNTVVVVNSGAPVLLPWLSEAAAVLLAWFPGQQMGAALADVLLGNAEPGGRMPTSWPAAEHQILPQNLPLDGVVRYTEGLEIGYRAYLRDGVAPALAFGHGLGYTTWRLGEVRIDGQQVAVEVTNTGDRAGKQVVQAYLSRPESAVSRPRRWLATFGAVTAGPGETVTVRLALADRVFEHFDAAQNRWAREAGHFDVEVGFSSAALTAPEPIG